MSGRHFPTNPMIRWNNLQPYLSGLISIDAFIEGKRATSYYPAKTADWPKAITRQWYRYNNGILGWDWPVSDEEDNLNKKLKKIPLTIDAQDQAGCFTGKMRQVVQKLHGAGRAIPFTHTATSSDGIFIPPGDKPDHEKQRWVIMIRRDGIYTAPIRFVKERIPENTPAQDFDRYDYHLLGAWAEKTVTTEDPAELGYKNKSIVKLRIGYKSLLDTIFNADKQPLIPRYGWAFNYSGSEAQIVLITSPSPFAHTYRYRLSFILNENGFPVCLGADLLDDGIFYTGSGDSKPLRIPYVGDVSTATGYGSSYNAELPSYSGTPVYVFYDRNNTAVVLQHSFTPQFKPDDKITDTRGDFYGFNWDGCPCRESLSGQPTDSYNQGIYTKDQFFYSGINSFTCERGIQVPVSSYSKREDIYNYSMGDYGEPVENAFCNETAYVSWRIYQAVANCYLEETHQLHDYQWADVVGWAFAEAEGFFHYRQCVHNIYERTLVKRDSASVLAYAARYGPLIRYDSHTSPPARSESGSIGTNGCGSFGLLSSQNIPDEVEYSLSYLFVGSHSSEAIPLTIPPLGIMGAQDQIYEALLGAYSENYILLPWPRSSAKTNGDYPYTEVPAFDEGPLVYPNFYWIGMENEA